MSVVPPASVFGNRGHTDSLVCVSSHRSSSHVDSTDANVLVKTSQTKSLCGNMTSSTCPFTDIAWHPWIHDIHFDRFLCCDGLFVGFLSDFIFHLFVDLLGSGSDVLHCGIDWSYLEMPCSWQTSGWTFVCWVLFHFVFLSAVLSVFLSWRMGVDDGNLFMALKFLCQPQGGRFLVTVDVGTVILNRNESFQFNKLKCLLFVHAFSEKPIWALVQEVTGSRQCAF